MVTIREGYLNYTYMVPRSNMLNEAITAAASIVAFLHDVALWPRLLMA